MFKRKFYQALLAGVLAAIAAIIYNRIYFFATEADFSKVLNPVRLTALSLVISMLTAFLNYGLTGSGNKRGEIIFNFLLSIISFACVMIPISYTLPLDIKFPELFPGLAVPMVFFPAIAWYTVNPLFVSKEQPR